MSNGKVKQHPPTFRPGWRKNRPLKCNFFLCVSTAFEVEVMGRNYSVFRVWFHAVCLMAFGWCFQMNFWCQINLKSMFNLCLFQWRCLTPIERLFFTILFKILMDFSVGLRVVFYNGLAVLRVRLRVPWHNEFWIKI